MELSGTDTSLLVFLVPLSWCRHRAWWILNRITAFLMEHHLGDCRALKLFLQQLHRLFFSFCCVTDWPLINICTATSHHILLKISLSVILVCLRLSSSWLWWECDLGLLLCIVLLLGWEVNVAVLVFGCSGWKLDWRLINILSITGIQPSPAIIVLNSSYNL